MCPEFAKRLLQFVPRSFEVNGPKHAVGHVLTLQDEEHLDSFKYIGRA